MIDLINLKKVLRTILNLEDDFTILIENDNYFVKKDEEIVCKFNLMPNWNEFVLKINKNNFGYEYRVKPEKGNLDIELKYANFTKDNINYNIFNYGYISLVDIKFENNCKGITLELENNFTDSQAMFTLISGIKFDEMSVIFEKINKEISKFNYMKLEKYIISSNNQKVTTDYLMIENGNLTKYLSTIEKNSKRYLIKKEGENYSLTEISASIESLNNNHFEIEEQIKFIKKLERK